MNKYIVTSVLSLLSVVLYAQDFKLDNVRYRTVSWIDFFKKLEGNPKLVYYDIRSQGERSDTSKSPSFNQGKIKGAIETDFADFTTYYPEYLKHKNDTIYLYCSHSRRSRLLAKQLMDSSFVNVININGGLSYLNTLSEKENPYRSKYYSNNLNYKLASPAEFKEALTSKKYQVIDIRPDSLYYGTSSDDWHNSFGTVAPVLHIAYDKIQDNLQLLDRNKAILLFDNDGELSPIAANYLVDKGYATSVLLFGLDNLVSTTASKERTFLKTRYQMILPAELLRMYDQGTNAILIDIRSEPDRNGTGITDWKNVGRLKNAINIPPDMLTKEKMANLAGKTIVIYDLMMEKEVFEFARRLKEQDINDLCILVGGIAQLKSEIYNLQRTDLKRLLEQ